MSLEMPSQMTSMWVEKAAILYMVSHHAFQQSSKDRLSDTLSMSL